MKRILFFLVCLCTSHGVHAQQSVTDRDGNTYAVKKMPDNKLWITTNLNIRIPGTFCYDDKEENCKAYGRLYTWKAAFEGCRLLGEGWRLATNEDWQKMVKFYGGVRGDSEDGGKAAYPALIPGGNSGFNIQFGGGYRASEGFKRGDAHGFYWTATPVDSANAWLYNFGKNGKIVNRHNDMDRAAAYSVRCIRD